MSFTARIQGFLAKTTKYQNLEHIEKNVSNKGIVQQSWRAENMSAVASQIVVHRTVFLSNQPISFSIKLLVKHVF